MNLWLVARRMRSLVVGMIAMNVITQGVATSPHTTAMEQLPLTLRMSVAAWHNASSRNSGGNEDAFSPHEDALILLQHVRDGVSLRQMVLPNRKSDSIKQRWTRHLSKKLKGLEELRARGRVGGKVRDSTGPHVAFARALRMYTYGSDFRDGDRAVGPTASNSYRSCRWAQLRARVQLQPYMSRAMNRAPVRLAR